MAAQHKTVAKSGGKSRKSTKPAKTASPKVKASSTKHRPGSRERSAGHKEVTIDRRRKSGRRSEEAGKSAPRPSIAPPKLERRKKVNRRRQIDPTTCERDYTDDEIQFMSALDDYKRTSGRMFPTCSEVLEVVRSLGYARLSGSEQAAHEVACPSSTAAHALTDLYAHDDNSLD